MNLDELQVSLSSFELECRDFAKNDKSNPGQPQLFGKDNKDEEKNYSPVSGQTCSSE